ncbi:MAG: PDZ domain-containing protein, partial [Planctomycetales bacterium]|nr:PDZ domain-containing protein [Planctomycetales bacterium]
RGSMEKEWTMKTVAWWITAVVLAAMTFSAGAVRADDDGKPTEEPRDKAAVKDDAKSAKEKDAKPDKSNDKAKTDDDFWIGVALFNRGEGLSVGEVLPGSPAEKAGLKEGDVVVSIGGKDLAEPEAVVELVRANKGKPLSLVVRRFGEEVKLKVKPERRPDEFKIPAQPLANPNDAEIDWNEIDWDNLMERLNNRGGLDFWRLRPGMVIPRGMVLNRPAFPKNTSVSVSRGDGEELTIRVEHGGVKYQVTEQTLNELPDEVRPVVERMLGRSFDLDIQLNNLPQVRPQMVRPGPGGPIPLVKPLQRDDRAIDDLRREMKELREELRDLKEKVESDK